MNRSIERMSKIRNFLINDVFIITLIVINTVVLFMESFPLFKIAHPWLATLDIIITVFFVVEMFIKIHLEGWKTYIDDGWNRLDFGINVCLVPSLFLLFHNNDDSFLFLTVIRLVRISKFFRFFRFVPYIDRLLVGIGRAFKVSIFAIIAFSIYLFIFSIFSCYLFKDLSPNDFGDPLQSTYSVFRIFTVEGWYEIADRMSATVGVMQAFWIKAYFVFLVLTGGVCGFSLINAIFVDEMVADNNDELLLKIDKLSEQVSRLQEDLNSGKK